VFDLDAVHRSNELKDVKETQQIDAAKELDLKAEGA
jgi:hypothetical protein